MEAPGLAETKPEEAKSESIDWEARKDATDKLIYNHTLISMGVGLIPLPLLDLAALTGVQIRLLYKLSHFYGQEFFKDKAKNIISALIGSVVPISLAGPLCSILKIVPLVGQTASVLSLSVTGGASTYALGKVFVQHFESGGTFLTFDPAPVKAHFAEFYREGQKVAADLKKTATNTAIHK